MGFGKKCTLQILGVKRDNLAEPLMGRPFAFPEWEFAKGGGAKRIVRFWGGGGKRTIKCPLQNQFWRPQKVGFVWSVPVSSKENDIA